MATEQRGSRKDDIIAQAIICLIISIVVLVIVTVLLCEKFGIYGLIFPLTVIALIVLYSRSREMNLTIHLDREFSKLPWQ
jgi:uncharacterized membrane protein YoaK (UPF0700 family)